MGRKVALIFFVLLVVVSFAGCAPGHDRFTYDSPAGFWWGLWHGMIAIIMFFVGLFTNGRYTIYEAVNTGWSYNLGFLIGVSALFGGSSSTSQQEAKRNAKSALVHKKV